MHGMRAEDVENELQKESKRKEEERSASFFARGREKRAGLTVIEGFEMLFHKTLDLKERW
jgi:hypothetical protein